MKRSLIAFQALLASSAVLCQTAEASSTYSAPEHLNEAAKANSIEARIEAVRNTDWGSLLNCLLYTSPSPRDVEESRMPSSA